jgi:hypothetical protein
MQKIEILKVNDPSEFWLAEKDPKAFLNMMSDELKADNFNRMMSNREDQLTESSSVESSSAGGEFRPDEIISVFFMSKRKWYRAKIIDEKTSFAANQLFDCYLLDTGEMHTVQKTSCFRIGNPKLVSLAPLAKRCSLFGIVPASYSTFR